MDLIALNIPEGAVCHGYALALRGVLNYVGVETKIVSGIAYNDANKQHAWNQVINKWKNI